MGEKLDTQKKFAFNQRRSLREMSKSAWGIGAWAAEAEREEAEEREAAAKAAADAANFPTPKESATTGKQKKKTKMTLQEFRLQESSAAAGRGLTPEEMLRLPTGPKERSADEMQYGRLGGGFSNYGSRSGPGGSNMGRPREYEGRSSYRFEDDGRREAPQQSRVSDFDQPSRADEVDNWASMKKQTLPADYNSREPRPFGKYNSLGGGGGGGDGGGGPSRADEVDSWASTKKPSQPQPQARVSSFGSGFSNPDSDRWTRNESLGPARTQPNPNLSLSSSNAEVAEAVKVSKLSPFGGARPREDVLAEKGLDWKKIDLEIAEKKLQPSISGGSRPTSSHSSRAETPQGEVEVKQKPKVNPFGDAKPREVLLEEKGLDWKKIDLNLDRRVDRPEIEEEKNLKEEIEQLKKELPQKTGEEQAGVQDLIRKKEEELELLTRQLDDKVRYSQRNFERPSSGASRGDRPPSRGSYDEHRVGYQDRPPSRPGMYEDPQAGYHERPRSRSGAYEDNRSSYHERPRSRSGFRDEAQVEYRAQEANERPRSRGNSWQRPSDDRRYFQGSGGRGFGSRDVDRSGSRW